MENQVTEITVFEPSSRRAEITFTHLVPTRAVSQLQEAFGKSAAQKARQNLRAMNENDLDLIQFRHNDRRIRIKIEA